MRPKRLSKILPLLGASGEDTRDTEWISGVEGAFLAEIDGIRTPLRFIRLDGVTRITPMTKSEQLRFSARQTSLFGFQSPESSIKGHFVRTRVTADSFDEAKQIAERRCQRAASALRVLKPGSPSLGELFSYQPGIRRSSSKASLFDVAWPTLSFTFTHMKIDRSDVESLRRLYAGMHRLEDGSPRVALTRFNSAHDRQSPEDKFIDLWIGLEALFSPRDEVRYRLALRIAYFLTDAASEREQIYSTVLDLYNLRSDVVHGRKLSIRTSQKLKLESVEAVRISEGYLRRALAKISLMTANFDASELDTEIARGAHT